MTRPGQPGPAEVYELGRRAERARLSPDIEAALRHIYERLGFDLDATLARIDARQGEPYRPVDVKAALMVINRALQDAP